MASSWRQCCSRIASAVTASCSSSTASEQAGTLARPALLSLLHQHQIHGEHQHHQPCSISPQCVGPLWAAGGAGHGHGREQRAEKLSSGVWVREVQLGREGVSRGTASNPLQMQRLAFHPARVAKPAAGARAGGAGRRWAQKKSPFAAARVLMRARHSLVAQDAQLARALLGGSQRRT
jgi:hypothetical protein